MFFKSFSQPAKQDIRNFHLLGIDLLFCSLDGNLYRKSLLEENSVPVSLVELDSVSALSGDTNSVIFASVSGIILQMKSDGDVTQMKLKTASRPRAIALQNEQFFVSDWSGNLYTNQKSDSYKFKDFKYEDRVVENGVNCMQLFNNMIYVGLSSGEVACLDFNLNLVFQFKNSDFPVRQVFVHEKGIFSAGNDGRCYFNYQQNSIWQKVIVSPKLLESEYILTLDMKEINGKMLLCLGGTGLVVCVLDVTSLLNSFKNNELTEFENKIISVIPVTSDIWCAKFTETGLFLGTEKGELIELSFTNSPFSNTFIRSFEPRTLPESKFALNDKNKLDKHIITQNFDFGDIETLEEINPPNFYFLCVLNQQITLVLNFNGTYLPLAKIPTETTEIIDEKGRKWDISYDINTESNRQLKIYMNLNEDAYVVGKRFLAENNVDGDEIDQIQQIREFIEKNAPKIAIADYVLPDFKSFFAPFRPEKTMNQLSPARSEKVLEIPEIKEISRQTAEKAFKHISGTTTFDQFCQTLNYTNSQIPDDPQQRSAFYCVVGYFLQAEKIEKQLFDVHFCNEVLTSFIESESGALAVMSARLGMMLMRAEMKVVFGGKADLVVGKCVEFLGQQDALGLILRIMKLIGDGDDDYQVFDNLVQNTNFYE